MITGLVCGISIYLGAIPLATIVRQDPIPHVSGQQVAVPAPPDEEPVVVEPDQKPAPDTSKKPASPKPALAADAPPKPAPAVSEPTTPGEKRIVTASGLALRKEPSGESERIHYVLKGDIVTILEDGQELVPYESEGIQGHWVHVEHGSYSGYVFDGFLSSEVPEPSERIDWICIPGNRVGPITFKTSYDNLVDLFGTDNVVSADVDLGGGKTAPGTAVFPDVAGRLLILWETEHVRPKCAIIARPDSTWKTPENVGVGTPLSTLVQLNGAAATVSGLGSNSPGTILGWNGGRLESRYTIGERCVITVVPTDSYPTETLATIQGEGTFDTDDEGISADRLVVSKLVILFGTTPDESTETIAPVVAAATAEPAPKPTPKEDVKPASPTPAPKPSAPTPTEAIVEEAAPAPAPAPEPTPEPEPAPVPAPATPQPPMPAAPAVPDRAPFAQGAKLTVMASSLNLRMQPATDAEVITKVPYGTSVSAVAEDASPIPVVAENMTGHWTKVDHEGKQGYVFDAYVLPLPAPGSNCAGLWDYAESALGAEGEPQRETRGVGADTQDWVLQRYGHDARIESATNPNDPTVGRTTSLVVNGLTLEQAFVLARRCEKQFANAPFSSNSRGVVTAKQENSTLTVTADPGGGIRITVITLPAAAANESSG